MSDSVNVTIDMPSPFEVESNANERRWELQPVFFDGSPLQNLLYLTIKTKEKTEKVMLRIRADGAVRLYTRNRPKKQKSTKPPSKD